MARHALPLWKRDTPRRALVLALGISTAVPLVAVPALAGKPGSGTPQGFSVSDGTVQEASAGTTTATFTISLSEALRKPSTVQYVTTDGTALAPDDYTSFGGTLTFAARETTKTLTVPVRGDVLDEADETFSLVLSGPSGAAIVDGTGVMTILDDDAAPSLAISDASALEGDTGLSPMTFNVRLSKPSGREVTVLATAVDGTAVAGVDYDDAGGTLVFPPGEVLQTVVVNARPDDLDETDETFRVLLSDASGATISDNSGQGRILDDDAPATPTIESTDPSSPAASTSPKVRGFAPEGTTVRIAAGCGGAVLATGTPYQFSTSGIPVVVASNATTQLVASAVSGATGKSSPCSAAFPYTTDTVPPAAPSGLSVSPAGPSNIDTPTVRGTSEAGSLVDVFTSSGCAGVPAASGTAAELAAGLLTPVPLNATSALSARARDAVGNASSCAAGPSYTHDGIAPTVPVITGSTPESPSDSTTPSLQGTTSPGASVDVYLTGDCTGVPAATVVSGAAGAWSTSPILVEEGLTTLFSAAATDTAGNRSGCSDPFAYTHYLLGQPTIDVVSPESPAMAGPGGFVDVYLAGQAPGAVDVVVAEVFGGCGSFGAVYGTFVDGAGGWQSQLSLSEGYRDLAAVAIDQFGNTSCSALLPYEVLPYDPGQLVDPNEQGGVRNDDPGSATVIPVPAQLPAAIQESGDVDFYRFSIGEESTVAAEVLESTPGDCQGLQLDSQLYVLDAGATQQFAFNDDIDPGNYCSRTDPVVLPAGEYLVAVLASNFNPGATFPYQLLLTADPVGGGGGDDGDNDPATAPFTGEGTWSGTLGAGDFVDWYRFEVTEPSLVSLSATQGDGLCDSAWQDDAAVAVRDLGSGLNTHVDDGSGPGGCPAIAPATHPGSLQPGIYAAGVGSVTNSGGLGDYLLTLDLTPDGGTPPVGDGNDTVETATPLADGTTLVDGAIDPAGDLDHYAFTVPAGQTLVLETSGQGEAQGTCPPGTQFDTILTLFDAAGSQVATDDDGGTDRCSRLVRDGLEAGTYVVRVSEYQNNATLAYSVHLGLSPFTPPPPPPGPPAAQAEIEPNDDLASAQPLGALPARVNATITPVGDDDHFSFVVGDGQQVTLETFAHDGVTCPASIDTVIQLLDSSGAVLEEDDQDGIINCSKIVRTDLVAGTYTVRVMDYLEDSVTDYGLTVTSTPLP